MALPFLVISRAPSLALFGTLEAGLGYFVYSQWKKPSMITGPLPTAIPKGYIGKARFQPHEAPQSIHIAHSLRH
ncbi:uncharacterized protein TRAVEDRAFT_41381 [Trametes versicolor FP-101664 SS1]|uniref:uncharacterized protein n=1 Tax=Trametes versicolor (strain FP-101664) TaxID=717944 RepID=UPI0004623F2D|nr:uncharacterized protein TRAVEDRAFT_41381 [Trametes versicolor FP-101664 SS1]EIW63956.1 hypothetical protein TRAVEDRAFT_41381 [Trametes versicolor FP-101664 SS1]